MYASFLLSHSQADHIILNYTIRKLNMNKIFYLLKTETKYVKRFILNLHFIFVKRNKFHSIYIHIFLEKNEIKVKQRL